MSADKEFLKILTNKRRIKAKLRFANLETLSDIESKVSEVVSALKEELERDQKEKADKQAKARAFLEQARDSGIDDDSLLSALGISAEDAREGVLANTKAKVKFRKSSTETWSGLGRKPKWVRELEANGQDLSDYKV